MARNLKMVIMVMPVFLVLLLGVGGVYAQPLGIGSAQKQPEPQYEMLSSENGRFVFGQISGSSKDQFMLDTATGRLWRMGESGKVGIFLKSVPYLSSEGECSALPDKITVTVPTKVDK
jgi:hypothetical protein